MKIISPIPTPTVIKFKAMNWLDPAKAIAENRKLSNKVIPIVLDKMPKAIPTGKYPTIIEKGERIPYLI